MVGKRVFMGGKTCVYGWENVCLWKFPLFPVFKSLKSFKSPPSKKILAVKYG